MFSNMADIDKGMDVFDVNGEQIGTVDQVYSSPSGGTAGATSTGSGGGSGVLGDESRLGDAPAQGGTGALGDESRAGTTPPGGTGALGNESMVAGGAASGGSTDAPYFKVNQGGVLGIGATSFYIPFSAVQNVVAGGRVTLSCTKEECATQYGSMPAALQQ